MKMAVSTIKANNILTEYRLKIKARRSNGS